MGALDPKNRRNLVLRVASAAVLFPIAVWLTFIGGKPFALLAAAAASVAAAELILMFVGSVGVGEVFGIAFAGVIPLMAAFGERGDLLPGWSGLALAGAAVLLLTAFLFRQEPLERIPRDVSAVALAWVYCGFLIATLVALRRFGVPWVILAFVVTWANDTFAYFAGHSFGRHKLYERISPKKTWEGFAGGVVGSVAGALVTRSLLLEGDLTAWGAVVIGLGSAVLGPIGDLAESMLKRAAGVKDSSRIIPGHGGLLDRIDALLFVAPWVYVCAAYFAHLL
jgi:phosphatidate cytidylyltransferase